MLPSDESTVELVPGWLASLVGAWNGELIVACKVSVAPGPPPLVSRKSR
jgi:hypothetical protein